MNLAVDRRNQSPSEVAATFIRSLDEATRGP
jgi:hypothetical protein